MTKQEFLKRFNAIKKENKRQRVEAQRLLVEAEDQAREAYERLREESGWSMQQAYEFLSRPRRSSRLTKE